jgi:hypothetical protein
MEKTFRLRGHDCRHRDPHDLDPQDSAESARNQPS